MGRPKDLLKKIVEFINQAFKSDELTRSHILEHDLAYQDAELPEQTKRRDA